MENISENQSKKKRGRPRVIPDELRKIVENTTNATTERHRQNVRYQLIALGVLMDDPLFSWLCDGEAMKQGKSHAWKPTILSELGRIEVPFLIQKIAAQICEQKPKVRDAVILVRRIRLGKEKVGNELDFRQKD